MANRNVEKLLKDLRLTPETRNKKWGGGMAELKIEYIAIEKLNHYENNSKIHTKEQIEHIANSIRDKFDKHYGYFVV